MSIKSMKSVWRVEKCMVERISKTAKC